MEAQLKKFIDQLLLTVGRGDVSMVGVRLTGTEVAFTLRRDVALLANLLSAKHRDHAAITKKASDVEAGLQTLQVLGQLSEQRATDLINELQDIIRS